MEMVKAVLLAFAMLCGTVQAGDSGSAKPVQGWISDVRCAAKGESASHEECLRQCVHNGDRLALVTDADQKALIVENPEALKGHEAHHVAVYGQVDSNKGTVRVDRVEMLAQN